MYACQKQARTDSMLVIYGAMAISSPYRDVTFSSGKQWNILSLACHCSGRATWGSRRGLNSPNGRVQFSLRIVAVSCLLISVFHADENQARDVPCSAQGEALARPTSSAVQTSVLEKLRIHMLQGSLFFPPYREVLQERCRSVCWP